MPRFLTSSRNMQTLSLRPGEKLKQRLHGNKQANSLAARLLRFRGTQRLISLTLSKPRGPGRRAVQKQAHSQGPIGNARLQ
jgi:hypothetical protein